jgi:reactive intermediate/imine deaminase
MAARKERTTHLEVPLVKILACALILAAAAFAADFKPVVPATGPKPVGPYSPGLWAGEYLYISGQGARNAENKYAADIEGQVRDCLTNVKNIVEAAGLTMEHVVYTQLYLDNAANYDKVNTVWRQFFAKNPPARATLGVFKMPTADNPTPVEVSAIAVRDLSRKKLIIPPNYPPNAPVTPGVMVGDRLYLSGFLGRDINTGRIPDDPAEQVQLALDRVKATLQAAGMGFEHMVWVNPYLTKNMPMGVMNRIYAKHFEFGNTPARATIIVNSLPNGANIEFTGVAIRDLSKRRAVRPKNMPPSPTASPCVIAEDTMYCSAKSAFIPGPNSGIYAESVEHQVRQTMRNLLDGLEEDGYTFNNVVATNVYVDDLGEFAKMNAVYAEYFKMNKPTRTTVQPIPPVERKADERGRWPKLEEISIVAVK